VVNSAKYSQPKIMLLDLDKETEIQLRKHGFNVIPGSLGKPYSVDSNRTKHTLIPGKSNLPDNYTEQDIVVIDLTSPKPVFYPSINVETPIYGHCLTRIGTECIDPRPYVIARLGDDFNRILMHGGVFIIFTTPIDELRIQNPDGTIESFTNWSYPSMLTDIENYPDTGQEIQSSNTPFSDVINRYSSQAQFLCTFQSASPSWVPMAWNKFNQPVAGAIFPDEAEHRKGWIFLLPQFLKKADFLVDILRDVLPDMIPEIFPEKEGKRWVHEYPYELPKIMELFKEIATLENETKLKIESLRGEVARSREEYKYLYDLIQADDEVLVSAVEKSLRVLGFQQVINLDQKINPDEQKREDLQIMDNSPILLLEIKGTKGTSQENKTLQVIKYLAPRMIELNRIDIQGLVIVNHQRHIAGLDREPEPFQPDILTSSQSLKLGLLTAWDLFRLVRNYLENNWTHQHIKELFYQIGRIWPVPTHYQYIGRVERFSEKAGAVGIRIESQGFRNGDRIAFDLPVIYKEQTVESIQLENITVGEAHIGQLVGVSTVLSKNEARSGTKVYLIKAM